MSNTLHLKSEKNEVTNLMDYGIQLGRRFRSLKLWMIMRSFGQEGLINLLREHIRLGKMLAKWIDASSDFHALPVTFSTVCFRYFPKDLKELSKKSKEKEASIENYLNELNEAIMHSLNKSGKIFLSHTKVQDRFTLRISIGNIKTTEKHVKEAWELLQEHAKKLDDEMRKDFVL